MAPSCVRVGKLRLKVRVVEVLHLRWGARAAVMGGDGHDTVSYRRLEGRGHRGWFIEW